jgi:predicted ribosomally synthesized peptide with nif11-like leader
MSLSECERFIADLKSNAALRAEAEKARADKSPLASMVALAVGKGYKVTAEEAREHLKRQAAAKGKVLSDADLDGVAGAGTPMAFTQEFWGVDFSNF